MQHKIVLVTGGTGTLGRALVESCCVAGWGVVANYVHDETRAMALRAATGCEVYRADVGIEAEVEAMFAALPPLSAVIHAAAISHDALLARQARADWADTLRVNADGAFLVTRAALQTLPADGRLVLLASRVGEHGNAGQAAYAASKAAVIALMRSAAREGAARQVYVNALCPGAVPSALTEKLTLSRLAELRAQSALGAFGTVQQVAATAQWLLSEGGAGITGQVIHCDSRI